MITSTPPSLLTNHSSLTKKAAFTLAEVLITLGIIGVVAAMTLPTLIQNYQKKETVNRLKHFSVVMQQAERMRIAASINGGINTDNLPPILQGDNPDQMLEYFNVYYKPYLKVSDIKKLTKGILVKLDNGSAFYLRRTSHYGCASGAWGCNSYIAYCTKYKYCKNINENATIVKGSPSIHDGKNIFLLYTNGRPPYDRHSREYLINDIKNNSTFYCASLIEVDGWEILDDNPCWK